MGLATVSPNAQAGNRSLGPWPSTILHLNTLAKPSTNWNNLNMDIILFFCRFPTKISKPDITRSIWWFSPSFTGLKIGWKYLKVPKWSPSSVCLPKVLDVVVMVVEEVLVPLELVLVALADAANTTRSSSSCFCSIVFFHKMIAPSSKFLLFNSLVFHEMIVPSSECENDCSEMLWNVLKWLTWGIIVNQNRSTSRIVNIWLFEGSLTFLSICPVLWGVT